MVAYNMRYSPTVQRARELLPLPDLVTGMMVNDRWDDAYWAQDPIQGGGNVLSQGGHTVDLITFLAGQPPLRVSAVAANRTHPGHARVDHIVAAIEFANGAIGSWVQGDSGASSFTSKFHFSLRGGGDICIVPHDRLKRGVYRVGQRTEEMIRSGEEALWLQDRHFVKRADTSRLAAQADPSRAGILSTPRIEHARASEDCPGNQ